MNKTKLGISTGLLAALAYFAGCFSGYLLLFLVAGYVLLKEEDAWLRKNVVKAVALMVVFSVATCALGLIPDLINWLNSGFGIINVSLYTIPFVGTILLSKITGIISFLTGAIGIVETVAFLLLGLSALKQKDVKISPIDKMIEKYM